MNVRTLQVAIVAVFVALASAGASAQTWNYKSYKKNAAGQWDPNEYVAGTISVDAPEGPAKFTLNAGRVDICYRGSLPAAVTKTDELTVIEVTQPVPGCEQFRYTIRNDGSGGFKEVKTGERWVRQRFDFDLTPKQ